MFMPPRIAVASLALATLCGCAPGTRAVSSNETSAATIRTPGNVLVTRVGDQVRYSGELTETGYGTLRQLTDGRPIRTLVIHSAGGEITVGMDFGDWVYERRVDVVVEEVCLSSCANYVFPAAKTKVIARGAVVAWHGSARQRGLHEHLNEVIEGQVRAMGIPPSQQDNERQRIRTATANYLRKAQERQDEFFRRIRVDEHITRIGNESYGIKGLFYLSIADMNRFGITGIVAPPDYERQDLSALVQRNGLPITYLSLEEPDRCGSEPTFAASAPAPRAGVYCHGQQR
jgi:hypothetical protein